MFEDDGKVWCGCSSSYIQLPGSPEKEDDYHYPYRDLPCPDIVLEIPGIRDGR